MKLIHVVFLAEMVLLGCAQAQVREVKFDSGSSVFDGWKNLNSANFSGYGSFPGSSPWPSPIDSNTDGSEDAVLSRVAGSGGAGPFLSSSSIYFGSFFQVPNALGGTLRVSDSSPLAGLRTVLLQIQVGEAAGYDFRQPTGYPMLKINGTTNAISPSFPRYLLGHFQSGTFPSPATGLDEPVYINTWIFQWNLGEGVAVSSLEIDFSCVTHAQVYELQLDQATAAFSSQIIPTASTEPPRLGILSIGAPQFNSSNNITTIHHVMTGPANTALDIEHSTDIASQSWVVRTNVLTGTGSFTNTISAAGDHRASWAGKMFFRAKFSSQ